MLQSTEKKEVAMPSARPIIVLSVKKKTRLRQTIRQLIERPMPFCPSLFFLSGKTNCDQLRRSESEYVEAELRQIY